MENNNNPKDLKAEVINNDKGIEIHLTGKVDSSVEVTAVKDDTQANTNKFIKRSDNNQNISLSGNNSNQSIVNTNSNEIAPGNLDNSINQDNTINNTNVSNNSEQSSDSAYDYFDNKSRKQHNFNNNNFGGMGNNPLTQGESFAPRNKDLNDNVTSSRSNPEEENNDLNDKKESDNNPDDSSNKGNNKEENNQDDASKQDNDNKENEEKPSDNSSDAGKSDKKEDNLDSKDSKESDTKNKEENKKNESAEEENNNKKNNKPLKDSNKQINTKDDPGSKPGIGSRIKNGVKNGITNKFNESKAGQAINKTKNMIENTKKIISFIVKHKGIILIALGILFVFILFIILLNVFTTYAGGAYSALNDSQYSYVKDNFEDVKITLLGKDNEEIKSNYSLDELLADMAYIELEDNKTEEQYKAFIAYAKAYILKNGSYSTNNLNLSLISSDVEIPNCDVNDGCSIYNINNIFYYYLKDSSLEGFTPEVREGSIRASVIEKAVSDMKYEIMAPSGTNNFDSITYKLPSLESAINKIIKTSSDSYSDIIKEIDSNYEVIDAEDTFITYNSSSCQSGEWWWPAGTTDDKCTKGANGVLICTEPNPDTYLMQPFAHYYNQPNSTHNGIDIGSNNKVEINVIATREGVVYSAVSDYFGDNNCDNPNDIKCRGNYVMIKHEVNGNVYYSMVQHLKYNTVTVKAGDTVVQGQKLGVIGSTGRSTTQHIHFQISTTTSSKDRIDPTSLVSIDNQRPGICSGGEYNYVDSSSAKQSLCLTMKSSGYSDAFTTAVLLNIDAEGAYNSKNLEGCYECNQKCVVNGSPYGYQVHKDQIGKYCTDDLYTSGVDSGAYKYFTSDRAGYGIVQWTDSGRKTNLLNYAKKNNKSIGDFGMQIGFMLEEVKSYKFYSMVTDVSSTSYDLSLKFCTEYETPATSCSVRVRDRIDTIQMYVKNNCS